MCGIFGYVADGDGVIDQERLQKIARVTEQRGRHAFGFAWVDERGRVRAFKKTGKISDHLGLLAMARNARMLIGHTRFATQGDPDNNLNNHPHPSDGGWIVHNGMIPGYRMILEDHDLEPVTDCDSEVIGLMVETFNGTRTERIAAALQEFPQAAAVFGLWSREMIAARRGNPLHIGRNKSGIYLASYAEGLPGEAQSVKDGRIMRFTRKAEGKINVEKTTIEDIEESEDDDSGACCGRDSRPAPIGLGSIKNKVHAPIHGSTVDRIAIGRSRPRFERS